jgi:hypothetical protein
MAARYATVRRPYRGSIRVVIRDRVDTGEGVIA